MESGTNSMRPCSIDGSLPATLRALAGGHVDLTDSFHDHELYVEEVTFHALALEAGGYLLEADADAIIQSASDSDIGSL